MFRRNRSFFVVATNDVEREWQPADNPETVQVSEQS